MSTVRRFSLWTVCAVLTVMLVVGAGVTLSAAVKSYTRAEKRYEAENQAALTHMAVSRAKRQARITRALTGHRLRYEAIQAQKTARTSGRSNMLIYDPQNVTRLRSTPAR